MEEYLEFGESKVAPLGRGRRAVAMEYVKKALASAAPRAVEFQVRLVEDAMESDDLGMKALGFKASEAILDRFGGKASQEIRVGDAEARPIVFSEKLRALNDGMKAALGAGEGKALEAFSVKVTESMDTGGVTI